jgi:predicted alpha/beta-hydrolase family hydrolase
MIESVTSMKRAEQFEDKLDRDAPVRGFIHRPANAQPDGLILTHGAGSNCGSPLLVALAETFCGAGWMVLRCDLPFRQARPHGPPPRGSAERDQAGLRAALAAMRRVTAGRIYLGGHSYGGRQASMLAASEPGLAEALLLLSYPLHPPQRPAELRTAHSPELRTPVMFVHGTSDGFGTIAEIEAAIGLIPARTHLLAIPDAGHELMTRRNRKELAGLIMDSFLNFIAG